MLKGKNIELRALEPADVELLYQWENDESIWYLSNTVSPFSKFQLEQFVMNSEADVFSSKQLRLMIDKKEKDKTETVGSIDIFDFDPVNKRAGIGILISNKERKKGIATESLEILIKYCFEVLHLHQVYCNITTDNVASLSLFKKFNFSIKGTKTDWLLTKNTWKDEYFLQLLNSEKTI